RGSPTHCRARPRRGRLLAGEVSVDLHHPPGPAGGRRDDPGPHLLPRRQHHRLLLHLLLPGRPGDAVPDRGQIADLDCNPARAGPAAALTTSRKRQRRVVSPSLTLPARQHLHKGAAMNRFLCVVALVAGLALVGLTPADDPKDPNLDDTGFTPI